MSMGPPRPRRLIVSPYRPGDFVICMYPFRERPGEPGPSPHIGYCVAELRKTTGVIAVVALFTTTKPLAVAQAKPRGVIEISQQNAAAMGQRKAFLIDARRIAYMRLDARFFPHLSRADRGIVGRASAHLHNAVMRKLADLFEEPDLIEFLGPERPDTVP
jgi:hypothetical protein